MGILSRYGKDFSDALCSHYPFLPPGLGDEPDDGGTGVVLGGRAGLDCEGDVLGEDEGLGLPLVLDEDDTEGEYCALGVQVVVGGQKMWSYGIGAGECQLLSGTKNTFCTAGPHPGFHNTLWLEANTFSCTQE